MEKKFLDFVAEIMEEEQVSMDMRFKEGKWDSLMMLTLVMELEAEYEKTIPIEKLADIKTLSDVFELIK